MSTEKANNASRGSLRLADRGDEAEQTRPALPRQFVNFTFYHVRPEWRFLDEATRDAGKREFLDVFESFSRDLLMRSYSIVGLRSNADFMIWRFGYALEPIQELIARLNRTGVGRYLDAT